MPLTNNPKQIQEVFEQYLHHCFPLNSIEIIQETVPEAFYVSYSRNGTPIGAYFCLGLTETGLKRVENHERDGSWFPRSELCIEPENAAAVWLSDIYFNGSSLQKGLWILSTIDHALRTTWAQVPAYSRVYSDTHMTTLRGLGFEFHDTDLEIEWLFDKKFVERRMKGKLMFRPVID